MCKIKEIIVDIIFTKGYNRYMEKRFNAYV
jgi:hypothetical protein